MYRRRTEPACSKYLNRGEPFHDWCSQGQLHVLTAMYVIRWSCMHCCVTSHIATPLCTRWHRTSPHNSACMACLDYDSRALCVRTPCGSRLTPQPCTVCSAYLTGAMPICGRAAPSHSQHSAPVVAPARRDGGLVDDGAVHREAVWRCLASAWAAGTMYFLFCQWIFCAVLWKLKIRSPYTQCITFILIKFNPSIVYRLLDQSLFADLILKLLNTNHAVNYPHISLEQRNHVSPLTPIIVLLNVSIEPARQYNHP